MAFNFISCIINSNNKFCPMAQIETVQINNQQYKININIICLVWWHRLEQYNVLGLTAQIIMYNSENYFIVTLA